MAACWRVSQIIDEGSVLTVDELEAVTAHGQRVPGGDPCGSLYTSLR